MLLGGALGAPKVPPDLPFVLVPLGHCLGDSWEAAAPGLDSPDACLPPWYFEVGFTACVYVTVAQPGLQPGFCEPLKGRLCFLELRYFPTVEENSWPEHC